MAETKRNPALRILGLPALPRKLPSRNWLIFWIITSTFSAAVVHDRRETRRATAKWAHAVEHLAREPLPRGDPNAMPRKLSIFLSAPPGDGLRVSQDWFTMYAKPVLAASGLDWDFVQGRRQGDVRAVVAERVRKMRRLEDGADEECVPTDEELRAVLQRAKGIAEYEGVRGDVVIGRHTWKEYVRGLHEGWLGPLRPPVDPMAEPVLAAADDIPAKPTEASEETADSKPIDNALSEDKPAAKKAPSKDKLKRPPQIKAYNNPNDYPASPLPQLIPSELVPAVPVPQRHLLGFLNTPTRFWWFLNRRSIADSVGRQVASACLAAYCEWGEPAPGGQYEQQLVLQNEEKNWVKSVWKAKEEENMAPADGVAPTTPAQAKEYRDKTWVEPVVMDSRIAMRMRKFEMRIDDEERAKALKITEEEIEGWIKGSLRGLYRLALRKWNGAIRKSYTLKDEDLD